VDGARFLALGDSYTIGEGVLPAERWPVQLAALLRKRGVRIGEPEIIAATGWTTDELASAIDIAGPGGPYALVTLLIGVNNQYRGRGLQEYRAEFAALLRRAIGFGGDDAKRVLVLSIPDWGVTPFAAGRDGGRISREVDAFNEANRAECAAQGVVTINITPISREMAESVVADGVHHGGEQYARWAAVAVPEALAAMAG
jgi:lysophospholipase L1-like esterase